MTRSSEDVLRKIKALLRTANDAAASAGEVEAALGRVSHLSAKYGVSDAEIQTAVRADGTASIAIRRQDIVDQIAWKAARISRWDWTLLSAAALATDCSTYRWSGSTQALHVFGLPTDVAVCLALFEFAKAALSQQVRRFCKRERAVGSPWVQSNSVEGRSFKDGFCAGLTQAAVRAKRAQETDTVEAAPVKVTGGATALVPVAILVEAKKAAVDDYERAVLNLRPTRAASSRYRDDSSYSHGVARGQATSLGRDAIGS